MPAVCIVGLPVQLRTRLIGTAKRRGVSLTVLLTDFGPKGTLWFIPSAELAHHLLNTYTESLGEDLGSGEILVLPYAHVPPEIDQELAAVEELGGRVRRVLGSEAGWPPLPPGKLDQQFLDAVYAAVVSTLPASTSPAARFAELAAENPRLLITKGSLEQCDDVAPHRYEFMVRVANAFDQLLRKGAGGRIDAFFAKLGLDHAQSGGVTTTLKLLNSDDDVILEASSNMHLKQGDKTTPSAAARVYYQLISINGVQHIALMYAGPHPEDDITRIHKQ